MYFKLFIVLVSFYGLFSLFTLPGFQVDSHQVNGSHQINNSANTTIWRRFRRQILPVEHLNIHSIQSNITINNENINAVSSESIIGLRKEPYNATLFSRHSDAKFDSNGTFVQINAQALDFALLFQKMIFRTLANSGDMEMRVNPQTLNHSMLRVRLADNVQFGLTDEQSLLKILSSNATQISVTAATDQQALPRQLQLGYDNKSDVFRVQFTEDQSRISVEISRSILHINYGNLFLQMDKNYRRLVVLTSGHRIEVHTLGSQFHLQFDQQGMAIVYPNDKLRIRASNNSKNVSISVDTLSKMSIRRTEDSKASLKGSNFTNVALNNLEVVSVLMNLNLYADNDSLIMATTNQSRVTLNSNSTEVLLASTIHQIEILGKKPFLIVSTESLALVITSTVGQYTKIPQITVPNVDYNRYNLQNLTQLDSIALNTTLFTSKINLADLIGEDIIPIQNFSSVIGAQQLNNTTGGVTMPPIIINTGSGTTVSVNIPTLFPDFPTLSPLGSMMVSEQTRPITIGTTINPGIVQVTTPPTGAETFPPTAETTTIPQIINLGPPTQPAGLEVTPTFLGFPTYPPAPTFSAAQTFPPTAETTTIPQIINLGSTQSPPSLEVTPTLLGFPTFPPAPTFSPIAEKTTVPQIINPDLNQPPLAFQTTINPAFTNLPPGFPTPSTIQQAIAETGFPMPPLNMGLMNDDKSGSTTIVPNGDDNFVFSQFETQPPNSFPLEATIVNVSLSATTPMASGISE